MMAHWKLDVLVEILRKIGYLCPAYVLRVVHVFGGGILNVKRCGGQNFRAYAWLAQMLMDVYHVLEEGIVHGFLDFCGGDVKYPVNQMHCEMMEEQGVLDTSLIQPPV